MKTIVKLKHVNAFTDRYGHQRVYFRAPGMRAISMTAPLGSTAFMVRYNDLMNGLANPSSTTELIKRRVTTAQVAFLKGTIGWIIEKYLVHADFLGLKPGTQVSYRNKLDEIKRRVGGSDMEDLKPTYVRILRDEIAKARGTSVGDQCVTLLRVLWTFAGEHCQLELGANPAFAIKRVHEGGEYEPWEDWALNKFTETAPPHLQLAFSVLLYTGQRVGDAVKMKWSDISPDGSMIEVEQEKGTKPGKSKTSRRSHRIAIPLHPKLQEMLQTAPHTSEHIVLSGWGKPYGEGSNLSHAIRNHLKLIGATEFVPHGLRKNATVRLIEAGCTDEEAAAITGHKSPRMVHHYGKRARQPILAKRAMAKLLKSEESAA